VFSFFLFYKAFKDTKFKLVPILCIVLYIVSWIIDMLFLSGKHNFFYSFSYTVANLLLLILLLIYFSQLVFSDAILTFQHNMMFWISTGFLIYYMGSFPYYGLRNTLALKHYSLYVRYSYLEYLLNCIMYIMFTLSFIWGKPNIRSL